MEQVVVVYVVTAHGEVFGETRAVQDRRTHGEKLDVYERWM